MIKEVRAHYGFAQEFLADYLGVSRSLLSMAESGRRELSGKSSLRLLKLYMAISAPLTKGDQNIKTILDDQKRNRKKIAASQLTLYRNQLQLLEWSLEKIQARQAKALKMFSSITAFEKSAEPFDSGMLKIIEFNARKLHESTTVKKQLELESKIEGLKAAIEYLEKV